MNKKFQWTIISVRKRTKYKQMNDNFWERRKLIFCWMIKQKKLNVSFTNNERTKWKKAECAHLYLEMQDRSPVKTGQMLDQQTSGSDRSAHGEHLYIQICNYQNNYKLWIKLFPIGIPQNCVDMRIIVLELREIVWNCSELCGIARNCAALCSNFEELCEFARNC